MALRFWHLLVAALLGGLVASALPAAALWVIWVPFGPHGNLLNGPTVFGDDGPAAAKEVVER